MKKYVSLALALVLTASVLVGCGCTKQDMQNTSAPTVLPTNEERWTEDTVHPTRESTTGSTMTTLPTETHDRGNGPLEEEPTASSGMTESTTETGGNASRSRSAMPNMR